MRNRILRTAVFAVTVTGVLYFFDSCKKDLSKDKPADNAIGLTRTGLIPGETGLPDLTIDAERLASSVVVKTKVFKENDCAVVEGCAGAGKRKLMRFDVATPNIGTADMFLGSPVNNPLFI